MADQKFTPVRPNALILSEAHHATYTMVVPANVEREAGLAPGFWSHIAWQLKPHDRIDMLSEDGSFMIEYIILSCERTWAKAHELHYHSFKNLKMIATPKGAEEFLVKHRKDKAWSVVRLVDNAIMIENLKLEEDAKTWLSKYLKSVSRAA